MTLSGLNKALVVGLSATIHCTMNVPVTDIEWRDQSSAVLNYTANQRALDYNISLVTDDLQGQQFTCVAMAGSTTYTETVEVQVEGKCSYSICYIDTCHISSLSSLC